MRKRRHLDDLVRQAVELREANGQISAQVKLSAERCARVEAENRVIRARVAELAERLRSVSSLLQLAEVANGVHAGVPEIPDPLLQPWRLPFPAPPIMASADVFRW